MNDYRLSDLQISELRSEHRTLREKRDADRVKAVLLLGTGWSVSQVAEVLLMDPNTVRTYHRLFSENGLEGLLTRHNLGSFKYLATEEEAELKTHLEQELDLTAKSVAAYIKAQWDSRLLWLRQKNCILFLITPIIIAHEK